jgi:hypothetical protein
LTQKNGERCSAARAYIHPHMGNRANLRVETQAHATRILFEGKRAVGVEYRQGKELKQIRRPARGDRLLRRIPDAAVADALRRRRQRRAWQARHRHRASSARRRTEPAGSPDFVFGYMSDNPNFNGISLKALPRLLRAIGQYRRERPGR